MPGFGMRSLKWSYDRIKQRDFFRQSVSLTYKGEESYALFLNGWISSVIMISLLVYGIILAIKMFKYSEVDWNQNTEVVDLLTDSRSYKVKESDKAHIMLTFRMLNSTLDSSYKFTKLIIPYFWVEHGYKHENGTFMVDQEFIPIKEYSCTEENFPDFYRIINNTSTLSTENHYERIWFNLADYEFGGAYESPLYYKLLNIAVYPCYWWEDGSDCMSKSASLNILYNTLVTVSGVLKSVTLNDIDNPIRWTVAEFGRYMLKANTDQRYLVKMQRIEATLEDSLISYYPPDKELSILTLGKGSFSTVDYADNSGITGIQIGITLGSDIRQFHRKVYNIFELIGTLGGIFEVFDLFFGFILGSLSGYMFKRDLKNNILRAETQYQELKAMIEELKKEVHSEPNQSEDDSKQEESKHLIEENKVGVNRRSQYEDKNQSADIELSDLNLNKIRSNPAKIPTMKDVKLDDFSMGLDWVEIVYNIKTLRQQVAYLLERDKIYTNFEFEHFGDEPNIYKRNLNLDDIVLNKSVKIKPKQEVAEKSSNDSYDAHILVQKDPFNSIIKAPCVKSRSQVYMQRNRFNPN